MKDAGLELLKYFQEGPGWVPLAAFMYVMFEKEVIPDISIFGIGFDDAPTLFVTISTLILYAFGDALDKFVYNGLERRVMPSVEVLQKKSTIALFDNNEAYQNSKNLEADSDKYSGIYRVSKSLAKVTGVYHSKWIGAMNEMAKFLRSLVIPCVFVGIIQICSCKHCAGLTIVAGGLLLCILYAWLKAWHKLELYRFSSSGINKLIEKKLAKISERDSITDRVKSVKLIRMSESYQTIDRDNIRFFFWQGELVASGRHANSPGND